MSPAYKRAMPGNAARQQFFAEQREEKRRAAGKAVR